MVMEEERMKDREEKVIPPAEMAESPNGGPVVGATNSTSEDSNQLKQNDTTSLTKNSDSAEATSNRNKGKSCRGCLYYSSRFKADSRNPLCVGLTRSLPNVPRYIVGQSEMEASKEGRSLTDFRYACVGYSLYADQKDQAASNGEQTQTELPVCVGLEVLIDRRVNSTDSAPVPTHIHNKEDGNALPQRRSPKPTTATGDEFLSRFTRNANLVANGVVKNIRKVGNQIKQSLDDILYPYRRRPK